MGPALSTHSFPTRPAARQGGFVRRSLISCPLSSKFEACASGRGLRMDATRARTAGLAGPGIPQIPMMIAAPVAASRPWMRIRRPSPPRTVSTSGRNADDDPRAASRNRASHPGVDRQMMICGGAEADVSSHGLRTCACCTASDSCIPICIPHMAHCISQAASADLGRGGGHVVL
jgi:hypothetical protein